MTDNSQSILSSWTSEAGSQEKGCYRAGGTGTGKEQGHTRGNLYRASLLGEKQAGHGGSTSAGGSSKAGYSISSGKTVSGYILDVKWERNQAGLQMWWLCPFKSPTVIIPHLQNVSLSLSKSYKPRELSSSRNWGQMDWNFCHLMWIYCCIWPEC